MSATNTGTLIGEERSDTWMHLVVSTAATAVIIVAAIVAALFFQVRLGKMLPRYLKQALGSLTRAAIVTVSKCARLLRARAGQLIRTC